MPARRTTLRALGAAAAGGLAGCAGVVDDCSPRTPPDWRIGGAFWSPPAVADGAVYAAERYTATGVDGRVSRIVRARNGDGRERWVETVETGTGWPTVTGDTAYVGTGDNRVFAFEAATGHRRWVSRLGGAAVGTGVWSRPAVTADLVVVGVRRTDERNPDPAEPGDYTAAVAALARADGRVVWERPVDRPVFDGVRVADGAAYAATGAERVVRFDAATGEREWTAPVRGAVSRRPLLADGAVVVATAGGRVATVDRETGERRWAVDVGAAVAGIVRLGDRLVTAGAAGTLAGITLDGRETRRLRVAEHRGDRCGLRPTAERGRGLLVRDDRAFLTGPWIAAVSLSE